MSGIGVILIILQIALFLGQKAPKGDVIGTIKEFPKLIQNIDPVETALGAIGIEMIPRGEVRLVFSGIGSASGVLSKPLEAAIIMMVILTTFLAPSLLRVVFKGAPESAETLTKSTIE